MTSISRRAALAASLSGLAAASIGAAVQPGQASAAETIVINTDDLAGASRRLTAEYRKATTAMMAIYDELAAQLPPDQARLLRDFSDAQTNADCIGEEARFAELARHLPGLYTVIRMMWLHVDVGRDCCTVAEGFEP